MLIRNLHSLENPNGLIHVYVDNNGIKQVFKADDELPFSLEGLKEFDAEGKYTILPGMLDSHVHGQGGPDFADVGKNPDDLDRIMRALGETGLSYAMATLVSLELNTLKQSLQAIDSYIEAQMTNPTSGATQIVGVHLEGPFIAKNCRGAHAESALQDNITMEKFKDIISAAPHVKEWKMTLAPDLPGVIEFIQQAAHDQALKEKGITVHASIGHTNPNESDITAAVGAGAKAFTHLGNACMETCCRLETQLNESDATSHLVKWVLANPEKCPPGVELIVDRVHLSKSFVVMIENKVADKIQLVTDALGPSGLPDGSYMLGELPIVKEENNFYLEDGKDSGRIKMKEGTLPNGEKGPVKSLAGSAAPLSFCIENYIEWVNQPEDTVQDRMHMIRKVAVENPKVSSLSENAIANLPEDKNFAIFNNETNQLAISLCHGFLRVHQPAIKLNKIKDTSHAEHIDRFGLRAGNVSSAASTSENEEQIKKTLPSKNV